MPAPPQPNHPLAPCTVIALEVIAASGARHLRMSDFELLMHQRGCDAREVGRVLGALARRGWAFVAGSAINVSDAGWNAASEGAPARQPPARRKKRRERMPQGLL